MTSLQPSWRQFAERELLLARELRRRQSRASLLSWCEDALRPLGQIPAAHHRLLIRELEMVANGQTKRLMINMPPGSAKSTYGSVLFPPWLLARRPNLNIIGASNTSTMAEAFSRRVMQTIRDHPLTLGYGMGRESAEQWDTTNGGRYRAAGVGGAIAGTRADCLVGSTIVQTLNGPARIDDIDIGMQPVYILSHADAPTYRRVIAIARRQADAIWRIRTASGRVVEATGNHRFWTDWGWREASSLCVGDVLLSSVRQDDDAQFSRSGEVAEGKSVSVLRTGVRNDGGQCEARNRSETMQSVQRPVTESQGDGYDAKPMFRTMQGGGGERKRTEVSQDISQAMRDLRCGVPSSEPRARNGPILLCALQEQTPFSGHKRAEQSGLEGRGKHETWLNAGVASNQTVYLGSRQHGVCDLQVSGLSGRSPHQPRPIGQSPEKPCDVVPETPSTASRSGTLIAESDPVAVVERVCGNYAVWDIQVEDTQCFYANGVLVHNCVLIDDPTRSRADAESETVRESQWAWFTGDLRTRLKPDAAIVVIMTRWHPDDLGGRLLDRQPGLWRVISLPAIAEDDDALGREPGEWLWSDDDYGYGAELKLAHAEYEAAGAMRDWSALYQQRPVMAEGSLFKTAQIGVMDAAPAGGNVCRAWDLAATAQTGTRDPDWTVGVKFARLPDGRYCVLDVVRLRGGPDETQAAIVNTAAQDGRSVRVGLPQDPGQAGKAQVLYLTRALTGYRVESSPETGDKATRAAPVASQVNVGNCHIVRAPWNAAFLDELAAFPGGMKDDQVDALSRAFGMVGMNAGPIRISPDFMARARGRG